MGWIVVTPAHNEAERLPGLAATLMAQTADLVALWVVVDDGSTDGTGNSLPCSLPFPVHVLRRDNEGGLAHASEFAAFLFGADAGLALCPDATRVMKLDADVRLATDYLAALAAVTDDVGLVAGRIDEAEEPARSDHTRGALKCYSRDAYAIVRRLPKGLGWDVLDEVAVRSSGLRVEVWPQARSTVARRTGT
ncbi:MAG TPA: glycosyltransferase, partial [Mycobacteriales bacterium]|nr:glycosyltransferase [Mycobacteriales bacterium]